MINTMILGGGIRIAQAMLEAAPTVIVGILIAAYFQRVLGRPLTNRLFGGSSWRQLPQAWLMGMLLPVCSIGVIPILSELRRAGLAGGTLLAFGLTAPIFNPVSLLYGLSLSHPKVIATICLASLGLVTGLGWLWDRFFRHSRTETEPTEEIPYGWRRIVSVFLTMLRIAFSRDTLWMLVGVVGVGLLSTFLPAGSLQTSAERSDPLAPLRMAAVALPAYVTPMNAMVQLSNMFQHGNSISAAFTLLILGAGFNVGMIGWIVQHYGWRRAGVWLAMAVCLVVLLGYALDAPLYPHGVHPEGHTHAFDLFCSPLTESTSSPIDTAKNLIVESTEAYEGISLTILLCLILGGGIASRLDPALTWERALMHVPRNHLDSRDAGDPENKVPGLDNAVSPARQIRRDIVLPRPVVAGLGFLGLLFASIVGCFVYYPPKSVLLEELTTVNAETCTRASSGDWGGTLHWIPVYEDLLRKIQVGMYMRRESMTSEQLLLLGKLEESLESLEHAASDQDLKETKSAEEIVRNHYFDFRRAMAPESFPNKPTPKD